MIKLCMFSEYHDDNVLEKEIAPSEPIPNIRDRLCLVIDGIKTIFKVHDRLYEYDDKGNLCSITLELALIEYVRTE